jgi:CBS domain containing-hemolysin-like protein
MDSGVVLRLLAVLALVLANGFFVSAEYALARARRTRVRELIDAGYRSAVRVARAQQDLDRAISGTRLGVTLATLTLGWIGEPAIARVIESLLISAGTSAAPAVVHALAIVVAFVLIVYLHIVLGELAPKTAALLYPEAVSRFVAGPLNGFNRLMAPWIWFLNQSSHVVLRLLRLPATSAFDRVHSPDEIEMLVSESQRSGVVEEDEQAMIQGVFELTRTVVREVMTPRPDIVGVDAEASIGVILETAAESGFSRFPVFRESLDEIIGIVVVKDVLGRVVSGDDGAGASAVMREPFFVPDTKPVDDLIAELRHRKTHMAVVLDEFGGTDGIVTLEDLLEEIVGEIYDEHDIAEDDVAVRPDGRVILDGGASFSEIVDRFELGGFENADEYDTMAGYVLATLGRIPEEGDSVAIGEAELRVLELTERRITSLELRGARERSSPTDSASSEAS